MIAGATACLSGALSAVYLGHHREGVVEQLGTSLGDLVFWGHSQEEVATA